MRNPIAAGTFYPSNPNELKKLIESCFKSKFGPGKLSKNKITAAICPHAGYIYSGPAAAHSYSRLANFKDVILLGPNHTGLGSDIALSLEDWKTPFGIIKTNKQLAEKLLQNKLIHHDELAHKNEHSIEVQLPFLQYIKKDFKIVAISMKNYSFEDCKKIGKTLSKLNTLIIASSDFTHYGYSYGFTPFKNNIKENLYKLDKTAIDYILKLDSKSFFNYSRETTICGSGPVTTLIEAIKTKTKNVKLLKYYTSGDIANDYSNAVGYASIIFQQ